MLEPSPSPLEESSAITVENTPELELIPPDDAEFVSEELPPDFWDPDFRDPDFRDSEPLPEDERIDSSISAESFFDAAPGPAQPVKRNPKPVSEPDTPQPEAPQSEKAQPKTTKGEGRFGTPLFSELESLFPGRVVKVEEHPQEDDPDELPNEDDADDFQAA